MKRFHMNIKVKDLAESKAFYSALLGTDPVVDKPDYVKWMPSDPFINLSIEPTSRTPGIAHVGLQTETKDELTDLFGAVRATGQDRFDEGETVCCYASSEKTWTRDPDGLLWEAFHTEKQTNEYGAAPTQPTVTKARGCC